MKRVIVRYRVKEDEAETNANYIRSVFEELERTAPAGLRYASFTLEDGVSFVHVAEIDTPDGSNPLSATDAFKAFAAGLKERCEEMPVATEMSEIGSFNFFT